jgi:hypothetical protein
VALFHGRLRHERAHGYFLLVPLSSQARARSGVTLVVACEGTSL